MEIFRQFCWSVNFSSLCIFTLLRSSNSFSHFTFLTHFHTFRVCLSSHFSVYQTHLHTSILFDSSSHFTFHLTRVHSFIFLTHLHSSHRFTSFTHLHFSHHIFVIITRYNCFWWFFLLPSSRLGWDSLCEVKPAVQQVTHSPFYCHKVPVGWGPTSLLTGDWNPGVS